MNKDIENNIDEFQGKIYSDGSNNQFEVAKNIIASLSLESNEKILDIGCGDGRASAELALLVPNGSVLGIDISNSMIRFAEKNYASGNLQFQQQNVLDLKYYQEFDTIVSFTALHWVKRQKTALQNIYNALKISGKFVVRIPGKPLVGANIFVKLISTDKWKSYFKNFVKPWSEFGLDEYIRLLQSVGFKIEQASMKEKRYGCKINEFRKMNDAIFVSFIKKYIDKDLYTEFVEDYIRCFIEHNNQTEENIQFPTNLLQVSAVRTSY